MARKISFEKDILNKTIKEYLTDCFTETAFNLKLNKETVQVKEKPRLQFTPETYIQILALIDECSEEIAWLGRVHRDKLNFLIDKIYVFPQIVTGTSVTPDETAYVNWNMQLTTEEVNSIRFHGHSHVNMGVFASGIDTKMYNELLAELKQNDFYIFLIGNKKNEFIYWIYDLTTNTVYEKQDIILEVIDEDGNTIKSWAKDNIEEYIKKPKAMYNRSYMEHYHGSMNALPKAYTEADHIHSELQSELYSGNNPITGTDEEETTYLYERYKELKKIPMQDMSMEDYIDYMELKNIFESTYKYNTPKATQNVFNQNKPKNKKHKNNKGGKKNNARFN